MKKSKLFVARGEEIHQNVMSQRGRGEELSTAMLNHFKRFHSLSEIYDRDIEERILEDELEHIRNPKVLNFERGLVTFSPSSASKCERELYYKAKREQQDDQPFLPYQRRWVRNGSAVHDAVQKDLLLAEEHLKNPDFKVVKMPNGSPAWEQNLKDVKQIDHDGIRFQIFGMMDGILEYKDGSKIGFEFKTKSTTLGAIGEYLMKDAQDSHKEQAIAYSILFGIDEFIFVYESLAKDGWMKGEDAKPDMRAFYFRPTQKQKDDLLDKFARVARRVKADDLPDAEFPHQCIFCPYKTLCEKDGGYDSQWVEDEKRRKEEERQRKAAARKAKAAKKK